jgi:hypothetical protein
MFRAYRRCLVRSSPEHGGAALELSLSVLKHNPVCQFGLQTKKSAEFNDRDMVFALLTGLLEIWPATASIEVGPFKYFAIKRRVRNIQASREIQTGRSAWDRTSPASSFLVAFRRTPASYP